MYIPLEITELNKLDSDVPTIIIPFREQLEQKRSEQLKRFVSHIHRYHPDWLVLIVEQSNDGKKFNRGALLNIGAKIAENNKIDYVIFHDVDLLPLSKIVPYYEVFPDNPIHIAKVWTSKYDSASFLGGVLSMSIQDIKKTNGFPNNFWGWGGEDDVLRDRIKSKKIDVYQPTMRGEGYTELEHVDTRTMKELRNMTVWEDKAAERKNPGKSGYKNVKYEILETTELTPSIQKITVNIK